MVMSSAGYDFFSIFFLPVGGSVSETRKQMKVGLEIWQQKSAAAMFCALKNHYNLHYNLLLNNFIVFLFKKHDHGFGKKNYIYVFAL